MKKIALIAALAVMSSCTEDITGITAVDSGSLRFSFAGAGGQPATVFNATGSAQLTRVGNFQLGDWAYSERGPDSPMPIIVHASMTAQAKFHYATMQVPRDAQAGTVLRVDPACTSIATDCARMGFLFNTLTSGGATTGCNAISGTVRITARGSSRMSGTFQVVARCAAAPAGIAEETSITDGTFDVEIIDYDDYVN
jgi:hypothetical protein